MTKVNTYWPVHNSICVSQSVGRTYYYFYGWGSRSRREGRVGRVCLIVTTASVSLTVSVEGNSPSLSVAGTSLRPGLGGRRHGVRNSKRHGQV
ncbi:hypothetical protein KPB2_5512 [Klebsiella pneumoniae Kb677]|nr:hypothetical protein KPB2_5512 [Klebsiella pneumoniae Kb677]